MTASPILALAPVQRTVPPPPGPWRWAQTWHDIFFAHWRVPGATLRPHLPAALELDTFEDTAWVSVVGFRLGVRRRWLPPLGFSTRFVELNLRTYVRWRDEPGIYFLSIHAGKRLSVALARCLTLLPYVYAPICYQREGEPRRLTCGARIPLAPPSFDIEFTPAAPCMPLDSGSLDGWLLERYRAFVPDKRGGLCRMVVQHAAWQAGRAEVRLHENHLGSPWGLPLNREPDLAHVARDLPAWIWPVQAVETAP